MSAGVAAPPRSGHGSPPAQAPARGGGGGGADWVELTQARNDIDAHLLRGRLRTAGIEVRMVKDRGAPGAWLYGGNNPWAPVQVLVRRFQFEDARLVMAEISWDAPAADPSFVARPTPRSPWVWWATALALGLMLSTIALLQVARAMSACQLPVFCSAPVSEQR